MNVVNFSDGVDGLAAGRVHDRRRSRSRSSPSTSASTAPAILAAITAGAALGFLFHNFHPASVFMGDAGANLLGYLLGRRRGGRLAEDQRGRRPGRAAGDPRRAVPRHRLRGRQAAQVPAQAVVGRRQPLPPPDGADRLLPAQDRRLPVRLDAAAGRRWRSRCASSPTRPSRPLHVGWSLVLVALGAGRAGGQRLSRLRAGDPQVQGHCARSELRRADPDTTEHEIDGAGAPATSRPASSSAWDSAG